jgi:hypothetical protein
MAQTATERKQAERARKRAQGIIQVNVEVPEQHATWLKDQAQILRDGGTPHDAQAPEPLKVVEVEKQIVVQKPYLDVKEIIKEVVVTQQEVVEIEKERNVYYPTTQLSVLFLAMIVTAALAGTLGYAACSLGWI